MRRLAIWLRACADWLDPVQAESLPLDAVCVSARRLIQIAETFARGTSGEYKRYFVYSRLQKEFPTVPRRHLAFTIEQIMQEQ